MKERLMFTSGETRLLVKLLTDSGISAQDLKAATHINAKDAEDHDLTVPIDNHISLWQYAAKVMDDPALALHLSENLDRMGIGFAKRMVLYSATLKEALRHWQQYSWMSCPAKTIRWKEEESQCVITFSQPSPSHQSIHMVEYSFASAMVYSRSLTGLDLRPKKVCFMHPEPAYSKEYKKIFQSKVLFSQPENALFFSKKMLKLALKTPDSYMLSVLKQFADTHKARLDRNETMRDRVIEHMVPNFPKGEVDIINTAQALFVSRSTLQRKLRQEGTSFMEVRDYTRKELAVSYLKQAFSAAEIAYLLGFSAPSAFQHSFKRWFGASPGEMRKQLTS